MAAVFPRGSFAAEIQPNEVRAADEKMLCFRRKDYLITVSSGPCDGFIQPSRIAIGERFAAEGKDRTIGVIRATQAEKDIKASGIDIKKGEWTCIAAETKEDLDLEHNNHALWLYVRKCQPVDRQQVTTGTVQPIPIAEFLKLPAQLQAIYVGGIIEGMSFVMYGYSNPDLTKWTSCVRTQTLGKTTEDVVEFLRQRPNFKEGVGSALAQSLGKWCKGN